MRATQVHREVALGALDRLGHRHQRGQVQHILDPGDRLVLHLPYQLHPEHRAGVAENLARLLPEGVKPFILDGGVELSVLSADATDAALRDDALRAARAHLVDPSPAARERLEKALDQVKG